MVHWVIITLNSSFYSNRNFDLKDASISERARTHFLFWSYIMWFVIFMLPDWWCVLMCYFSYSSWASRRFLHMWYMALVLSLLGGSCQRLFQHLIPFPWSAVTKFCVNTQSFAWLKYLWLIVIMSAAPKNSGNRGSWVHHLVRHTVSPFQGMRLHVCKTGFIVKIAGCGIYYQPLIGLVWFRKDSSTHTSRKENLACMVY